MQFAPWRTRLEAAAFPVRGEEWLKATANCLQQRLEDWGKHSAELSCSALQSFAFSTHPDCYTQNPSFCALSLENVVRVGLTIRPAMLLSSDSLPQVQATAAICVSQLSARLSQQGVNLLIRMQLAHARGIWSLIATDPSRFETMIESDAFFRTDPAEVLDQ